MFDSPSVRRAREGGHPERAPGMARTSDQKDIDPIPDSGIDPRAGKWVRHVINDEIGGAIMFRLIPDSFPRETAEK